MPAIASEHIDVALTNLSIMYKNEAFVAEEVAPVVPVQKRSGKYFVYKKEDFLGASRRTADKKPITLRTQGTEAMEVNYAVSTDVYFCEEYALRELVTDAEVAIADNPLAPDMDHTTHVTEILKLDNEYAVSGLVGTAANYPSTNKVTLTTGGSGTSWASYTSANSLPFTNIRDGVLAILKGIVREPNRMLLSVDAARTLADHPLVLDKYKYTHTDVLTYSGLPKIIRGLQVFEAATQLNATAEGGDYSGGNLWQSDTGTNKALALIYYYKKGPSIRDVQSFAYTFEGPDDTTGVRGLAVRRYRDEKRKGTLIEVSYLRDWRFVGLDTNGKSLGGYLISGSTD